MKKTVFALMTSVLLSLTGTPQGIVTADDPEDIFALCGEVRFTFHIQDKAELDKLTRIISIDQVEENRVTAYASKKEFLGFLQLGYSYNLLPPLHEGFNPLMKDEVDITQTTTWNFYPTYDAYLSIMNQFQATYPTICRLVDLGTTVNGRKLLSLVISDNVTVHENEPQFLYTSSIHGDETAGYILMLHLADYLLTNYGTNPRITNLVDNVEIWINPLANPDGTYHGGNGSVSGATRYNANYVDLNRNYPDPEDGPHPDGNAWQPETVAFMNLAESNHFTMSTNFHGGAEVCNYPWDTWATLAADDAWWQYVCHEWADTAQFYSPSGYMDDYNDGITNGYQWYTISGGRQDYMNYFQQCREFTAEISSTKLLPEGQLLAWWDYNYHSLLNYIEQSIYGLKGIVTDSLTGQPLEAEVFILNHELDSSWVYSHLPQGDYNRHLYAGTYLVRYSAPGYMPKTFTVTVANRQAVTLDVQLSTGVLTADFTASATIVSAGGSVNFTDLSYGAPTGWQWSFEGGNPAVSTQQHPTGILYANPGTFDVTLTVSNASGSHTLTKTDYITVSLEYLMTNGSSTTCTGIFYDSGGPNGKYQSNEDYTFTFYPVGSNCKTVAQFTFFDLEYQSSCNYDWLKIYNGPSTSSTLIGKYCGTTSPGTVTSTHAMGALTFQFHSDYSVTKNGWAANIYCQVESFDISLKVMLQGPFNGSGMDANLCTLPQFPFSQPYGIAPWNYAGSESIASLPSGSIIDWVLIELRDAATAAQATPSTMLARQAAFVLDDGTVTYTDASSPLTFMEPIVNNLYAVVWHRNHLAVMSAFPLVKSGNLYTYDFTTSYSQVYGGTNGCRQLSAGIWGMTGGDGDASLQVSNGDKVDVWNPQAGTSGYKTGDFNLSGQVDNQDKNDIWAPNSGMGSQVPQ
jgi:PKD repeat protein